MLKNYYVDVWASLRQLRSLSLPAYNSGYAVRLHSPNPFATLRASHPRQTLSAIADKEMIIWRENNILSDNNSSI